LPDDYKVIVNTNHPLIVDLSSKIEKKTTAKRLEIDSKLDAFNSEKTELDNKLKDIKKDEDKPVADKTRLEELEDYISALEEEKIEIYKGFGKNQKIVSQLFDLALLSNNLLKGESLSNFVNRSVELLKK
jgi:molecular chaperone HtpG